MQRTLWSQSNFSIRPSPSTEMNIIYFTILYSNNFLLFANGAYETEIKQNIKRGQLETTVGEEKLYNPRLTKDIDAFVQIMENLNLPRPKLIGMYTLCAESINFAVTYFVCRLNDKVSVCVRRRQSGRA